MGRAIFITGTDTGVGKTHVTIAIGLALQRKGFLVAAMKPVQCGGNDAKLLKSKLGLKEDLRIINPYFAPEPLVPSLALKRAKITFKLPLVKQALEHLTKNYDLVLVEGAGGLNVPITENFFIYDLIKELDIPAILVSRLNLGTINHSLLTISTAQRHGINLQGIIFNQTKPGKLTLVEKTNPEIISKLSGLPILGVLPYSKRITASQGIDFRKLIASLQANHKSVIPPIKIGGIQKMDPCFRRDDSLTAILQQLDKEFIWHPFTQMQDWLKGENLVITEAKGCYLKDSGGKWYLDGISSLWVNIHGHRHPKINQALIEQSNKVAHSTMLGLANEPSIILAKKLIEIAPKGLKKVFYSDSGSTAVEIALKMAFQYWQNQGVKNKQRFIYFENSYHGDTIGSVSVGGISLFHKIYHPLLFKSFKVSSPYCYRCPVGLKYPDCKFQCLDKLKTTLKNHHAQIAALIVEPLNQAAAGMLVWPKGLLKEISLICKQYRVLLIADEVATGFGRTGKMFACEHETVHPDIMCLAKGITGGYLPLAATLATQEVYNAFLADYASQKTFFHGHSYTGNPLACACAIASLDIFKNEQVLKKLQPKIKFLKEELIKFKQLKIVGDIRQLGFMVGIELVKDQKTRLPFNWEERAGIKVCQFARARGVILRPLGNVIVLMPPLVISKKELKSLLETTFLSIQSLI